MRATDAADNLFGETNEHNAKVKFGAPHWVDFGQDLQWSPDGKAYLVGHGASRPEAIQAWMLGDEIYMARVEPTVEAIGSKENWEFYVRAAPPPSQYTYPSTSPLLAIVEIDLNRVQTKFCVHPINIRTSHQM